MTTSTTVWKGKITNAYNEGAKSPYLSMVLLTVLPFLFICQMSENGYEQKLNWNTLSCMMIIIWTTRFNHQEAKLSISNKTLTFSLCWEDTWMDTGSSGIENAANAFLSLDDVSICL